MPRLLLAPLLVLAACKGVEVPQPASARSAVLTVRVSVFDYMGRGIAGYPRKVYFARLPEGETSPLKATAVVESNYDRGSLTYLLNAEPGRYAVVCAVPLREGKDLYVFVPEKTAAESIVEVLPGDRKFMGSVRMRASRSWGKADAAQKHFSKRIQVGPMRPSTLQKLFPRSLAFIGEDGNFSRDEGDVKRAESTMSKVLPRLGWTG